MLLTEHFTQPPQWQAYIIGYFFLAGLAGGTYVLGTLLRLRGSPADEGLARVAFIASLVSVVLCPVLLTLDLGQPTRFWHMLIDTGAGSLAFKAYSPMSVGAYALLVFGVFSFGSAADAFLAGRGPSPLAVLGRGPIGLVWMVIGSLLGLYVAAYTGVLLAVSNQPVWSDAWPLGGLFLASGLSASAALLLLFARRRGSGETMLVSADRSFVVLEAILLVLFVVTVVAAGTAGHLVAPLWLLLWLIVLAGIAAPLLAPRRGFEAAVPVVVLVGVLALRAVVILSAQG